MPSDQHNATQILLREIFRRSEADVVEAAEAFSRSADPRRRRAAAWALTREQCGEEADTEAMAILRHLAGDSDSDVVCAALAGVAAQTSRRYDHSAFALMRRCEGHSSAAVRVAVLHMLQSQFVGDEFFQPEFLDICMRLSADPSGEVRQNACRVISFYSSEIGERRDVRDALFRRLNDVDRLAKYFAFSTLAELNDPRMSGAIEQELMRLDERLPHMQPEEAREAVGDLAGPVENMPSPDFIPWLKRWKPYADDGEHGDEWLSELISACRKAGGVRAFWRG